MRRPRGCGTNCHDCAGADAVDQVLEASQKALLATPWHAQTVEEVLAAVKSRPAGLSELEITSSRTIWGSNASEASKPTPLWRRIFAQVNNMLVYMLIVSFIVSMALQDWADGAIIGVVGCYKGYNAGRGTESVGKAANAAVVLASLLIIVVDVIAVQITDMLTK